MKRITNLTGIVLGTGAMLMLAGNLACAGSCGSHGASAERSGDTHTAAYTAKASDSSCSKPKAAGCGSSAAMTKADKGSCGDKKACSTKKDIVDTAVGAGQFATLAKALDAAGLIDTLKGQGPFTVFAPTDDAFAKLPDGAIEGLLNDLPKLRAVLKYHVVPGKVMAADVVKLSSAKTVLGQAVTIKTHDGVHVDNAKVVATDIKASNGVIHVIDSVIMPADDVIDVARSAGSFQTLMTAVHAAGMADALRSEGPFTIFAPTDDAFAKLPAGTLDALLGDLPKLRAILKYHVVPGKLMAEQVAEMDAAKTLLGQSISIRVASPIHIDEAEVIKADIPAANGVIHVIDAVILPDDDLLDVAAKAGSFSTLLAAVEKAGLEDTLRGEGPFTVFAPTDDAFAKLPAGTLDKLLAQPHDLAKILTYHVVPGKVTAEQVVGLKKAKAVNGAYLKIKTHDGVMINNARVVMTDVHAANGVIHVIDKVLLPR